MKQRILALLLAALALALLLTGCGGRGSSAAADSLLAKGAARESYSYSDGTNYAAAYEEDMYEYAAEEEYAPAEAYWSDSAAAAPAPAPASAPAQATEEQTVQKLIYTADLNMETLEFDAAVDALAGLTASCGGYYESSSVSDQGSYRWASYTIRVPAANYRAFLDRAGEQCHVLSLREYTEDVSETYYDTAGRLETQRTKLARLQALLAQAESMEDIIVLESAISETEEIIDRYSGQLRHYDALVDYSTVSVYLEEVKVYEPEPDPTYGTRLGTAFQDGLDGFAEGLGDILLALAYSWLWLLLIAAIVVLVLFLTRKRRAAHKAARAERKARAEARKNEPPQYSLPTKESASETKE